MRIVFFASLALLVLLFVRLQQGNKNLLATSSERSSKKLLFFRPHEPRIEIVNTELLNSNIDLPNKNSKAIDKLAMGARSKVEMEAELLKQQIGSSSHELESYIEAGFFIIDDVEGQIYELNLKKEDLCTTTLDFDICFSREQMLKLEQELQWLDEIMFAKVNPLEKEDIEEMILDITKQYQDEAAIYRKLKLDLEQEAQNSLAELDFLLTNLYNYEVFIQNLKRLEI